MKRFPIYIVILLLLFGVGCTKDYASRIDKSSSAFYSGKYDNAAKMALKQVDDVERDSLLILMEAGVMLHTGGEYRKSNEVLFEAVKLKEKLKISLSSQAASLLINERKTNYRGENFEHVLIHMYLGLNFLMMDDFESARVEFHKITRMLDDFAQEEYPDYQQNVMARYLTALCYEAIGDIDNDFQPYDFASLEYRRVHALIPKNEMVQNDLVRIAHKLSDTESLRQYRERFGSIGGKVDKSKRELVVFHQTGRGPVKKSRGKLLKDEKLRTNIVVSLNNMSLKQGVTTAAVLTILSNVENPIPDYATADNRIHHLRVRNDTNGIAVKTNTLEDIEKTALLTAEQRYKITRAKVAGGIAVKAAAAYASSVAAQKITEQTSAKEAAGLIGFVTGAAVGATLGSQIKPDLRCWHTLPANMQISRITLPPGEHDIYLDHVDADGNVYKTDKKTVEIKADRVTFLNHRTIR